MKAKIVSTDRLVAMKDNDGREATTRVWEGETEGGVRFTAYIMMVQVAADADNNATCKPFCRPGTTTRSASFSTTRKNPMALPPLYALSHARRNFLCEHIDGPRRARASDHTARAPLIANEFVRPCDETGLAMPLSSWPIKFTMLTDLGRDLLARVLADYAEKLISAGCLEPDAVPVTIIPFAVETVETRRIRGTAPHPLVVKERTVI